jgi:hypothetical protein
MWSYLVLLVFIPLFRVNALTLDHETGTYNDLVVAIGPNVLNDSSTNDEKQLLIEQCKVSKIII